MMLSKEEITRLNEQAVYETKKQYEIFASDLEKGVCPMCKGKLSSFTLEHPCMHWLLRPRGFKKKHFHFVYENFNLFRIDSFLRWLAHASGALRNVNDIRDESGHNKIFEVTIVYRNLEWTLSCAENCSSTTKIPPHYHFQMRIDGHSFIKFSDHHIPLTTDDLLCLEAIKGKIDGVKYRNIFGAGFQELTDTVEPEQLLDVMQSTISESESEFSMTTMLEAEPGKTISGDDIAQMISRSQELKIPFAKLVKEIPNTLATTIVSPSDGLIKKAGRQPRSSKRR